MTCSRPSSPQPFIFDGTTPVRVVLGENGEPWFVAADVCSALALANSRMAVSRLDKDERNTVNIADGIRGNPNVTVISEAGVYRLVFTSRVDGAERFKRWLAHEVLPAIRKTGTYTESPPQAHADVEALLAQPKSTLLRLAATLAEKNEQQAALIAQQGQLIEEQKPAVEFLGRFVEAKDTVGVRQVAKRINRKQNELVAELLRDKVLYRSEGKLTPFSEYQHKGYFFVKNGEKNGKAFGHARFTTKGITWASKRYGREAPGESNPPALPAGSKQSRQLALLPESTQSQPKEPRR